MIHAHDVIRKRLTLKVNENRSPLTLEALKKSEWSDKFEQLMRNRLVIGAFRYGLIGDSEKPIFDRLEYIKIKIKRYEETGNTEALVDIANLALLEYEEGYHPLKHFSSLDDIQEHAGIKRQKGETI